jgi:hypothetical protein
LSEPPPYLSVDYVLVVLFFMWVFRFCGCHMSVFVNGCFLGLDCVLASVWVWGTVFSAHDQHGAMLNIEQCGCGGAYRAKKFLQETQHRKNNSPQRKQTIFDLLLKQKAFFSKNFLGAELAS